jgi:hypothetical protein
VEYSSKYEFGCIAQEAMSLWDVSEAKGLAYSDECTNKRNYRQALGRGYPACVITGRQKL